MQKSCGIIIRRKPGFRAAQLSLTPKAGANRSCFFFGTELLTLKVPKILLHFSPQRSGNLLPLNIEY
jgi:hypothetical protein